MPGDCEPNDAWLIRAERKAAERERAREARVAANAEHNAIRDAQAHRRNEHKGAIRRAQRLISPRPEAIAVSPPDARLMSEAELLAWANALLEADRFDWPSTARPEQRQPPKGYRTWAVISGRGFGKTRLATEAIREWCELPDQRIAIIAKDHRALRDVNFDGPSGLIACVPPGDLKPGSYKRGLGDVSVEFANGSIVYGFTSEAPDAIRGRAFDAAVCDEYAAWSKTKADDMYQQLWYCLRDSADPRVIITTTPKRVAHVIALMKRVEDGETGLVLTTGKTSDNTKLSKVAVSELHRMYGGTRMGRQELDGILLTDVDNALFTFDMVEGARWTSEDEFPDMVGVITGVDPSGSETGDATGICSMGWDKNKVLYVLENRSTQGTPAHRYSEVCRSARRHGAGEIWSESAFSGDSSIYGIQQQWKNLIESGEFPDGSHCPAVKPSTIKGDKAARAMSVVALYEQQIITGKARIWHPQHTVGNGIAQLEDEMLSWSTDSKKSPNAIDAMVHAARQILRRTGQEAGVSSAARSTRRIFTGYRPF